MSRTAYGRVVLRSGPEWGLRSGPPRRTMRAHRACGARRGNASGTKKETAAMGDLRIVVGDDEPLMREAIRLGVDGDSAMTVVGEATTGAELIDVVRRVEPDLV